MTLYDRLAESTDNLIESLLRIPEFKDGEQLVADFEHEYDEDILAGGIADARFAHDMDKVDILNNGYKIGLLVGKTRGRIYRIEHGNSSYFFVARSNAEVMERLEAAADDLYPEF